MRHGHLDDEPLWYKDAIIYELHIRAFKDSNHDGIGDIRGLIEKLDHLESLGVTALWLLPFYPSPLRDDGYDIADYFSIHEDYGNLKDFRQLVHEAHRRGIRIITELVLNHTSIEHAWFQKSRTARPGSAWRNMYVWSDRPQKYEEARIIFRDFETSNWRWDPVANSYFWHRFYSHQPDLNYDSPLVHKKMFEVIDFWLDMGVDGLRLDAVPYLYEREETNCENLPETHAFLKKLRAHIEKKFTNRMLLAEANQWPEDAAAYFGSGDECTMAFHFPLMPRLFMAMQMEDSFPIIDIVRSTPPIPESCQWAIFLRNHDELTLEMVTDEERDYMYRSYAKDPRAKINFGIRRRLAPLLANNRRRIELMNILLFSFPGTPVIYYGDEIGMGDNYYLGDRNGVRTPMQWSPDRNAGFSRANPQCLYFPVIIDPDYHYEAVNVENQERNLSSLMWWMKRVIAVRKRYKALSRGTIEILQSKNAKVLAFVRRYEDEIILVAINLSRFSQSLELDLAQFAGRAPEELFSGNVFPTIRETPYMLTFGPHNHFWLLLRDERSGISVDERGTSPDISVSGSWDMIFEKKAAEVLQAKIIPAYIKTRRWFASKAKSIRKVQIIENAPCEHPGGCTRLLLVEVSYNEGVPDIYLLPVSFADKHTMQTILEQLPDAVMARISVGSAEGIVYDGMHDSDFRAALLLAIAGKKKVAGRWGDFVFYHQTKLRAMLKEADAAHLRSHLLKAEQSNSSIVFGDHFFMKVYRRLDEGLNPDLEVCRYLSERTRFKSVPGFAGAVEYRSGKSVRMTVAMLQSHVASTGDAWALSLDAVEQYCDRLLVSKELLQADPPPVPDLLAAGDLVVPDMFRDLIGAPYLEAVALLGKRTAEMHRALGAEASSPDFAPEPFTLLYQRSIFQSMQSLAKKTFSLLAHSCSALDEPAQQTALTVLGGEKAIMEMLAQIRQKKLRTTKIRIHGDYHLGQVLCTGNDFVIIDFEGEPARAISERRLKYSPFKDVAGMVRSFHYAAHGALLLSKAIRPEDRPALAPWVAPWHCWVSRVFINAYLEAAAKAHFVPAARDELSLLLLTYLLEKSIYEIGYELNNRPDWVLIPLQGILSILKTDLERRQSDI